MAKKFINESLAVDTSTALREKLGTTELIDPETWPEKIRSIESGSKEILYENFLISNEFPMKKKLMTITITHNYTMGSVS